jgi:mono/diheme cytochrome c family protein
MMRPAVRRARAWLTAALLLAGCGYGSSTEAVPRPTPQGGAAADPAPPPAAGTAVVSYTAAQADRGREVFTTICSACHAINEFRGQQFQLTWRARPIGDFYQLISTAMPQDRPGSLRPEQYAAVVAHVLQLNGHPPGTAELPADQRVLQGMAWPR